MIQRRREAQYETKTGHERWLVSYADFITLLFAFFVVMYSVSQVSDQKYRVLSETLAHAFEGKVPVDADIQEILARYPLDSQGRISGLSPQVRAVDTEILAAEIADSLVHMVKSGDVSILALDDSVEINVNANALFASASATPSDAAKHAFAEVAEHLRPHDYAVEVAGHTDDVPIKNAQFANNWELSAARATSIVGLLIHGGVAPAELKASGYGEFRPIADNSSDVGRAKNRRVVLTVTKPQTAQGTANPERSVADPARVQPPLAPEAAISAQASNAPATDAELPAPDTVEPVRLKNGGLLFSSDPGMPRK